MRISTLTIDGLSAGAIVDEPPRIAFALDSDTKGEALGTATITVGDWRLETKDQINNLYTGALSPHTEYPVSLTAVGTSGETAVASTSFRTGRLDLPWQGRWISDLSYSFPNKQSPTPMRFRRSVALRGEVRRAWIEATALGIYELDLNGVKVGDVYFAPGLTSYEHQLQYQTYDVTQLLRDDNEIVATVGGGWAVGSFTYKRVSKVNGDRQAFLCELHIDYADDTSEVIVTDRSWEVSEDGPFRMAEWYDGETFDATFDEATVRWRAADEVGPPKGEPALLADYGSPVRAQQRLTPVAVSTAPSGEVVYDFGQNFSGVVAARLKGRQGQTVVFRHAEVLVDGELFVKSLRTAKATATYTCFEGEQCYSPRLTYMGFRFVGVTGIDPADMELEALVLHSDLRETGEFECSNPLLNRLNENIRWGGRSNFVDIPTDCPQRDERQGWTGDLSVFATTASYNFDMNRFLRKWLRDVSAEQSRGGGIPMTVPRAGDHWPVMATACWGDACVLVPWAEYLARGDVDLLRRQYPTMKRFLKAAKWWSGLFSIRPSRRLIWRFPFHFGDWAAPEGGARDWLAKGKWIATAYFANSCRIVADIADLLGKPGEAAEYRALHARIVRAFRQVFTDGAGNLKKEFQTGYVLPLHFEMTDGAETAAMAANLVRLLDENDGHLATGFPGTPYILFALSDSGRLEEAYELLLNTDCPSWLYTVVAGGTTIWERWDALRPDGTVNIEELSGAESDENSSGGMVSFNHYAAGAVGDWLYRRIAGIEPVEGGYRSFRVAPLPGGGLTSARGSVLTPYGRAESDWRIEAGRFFLRVVVPVSTTCEIVLPDGSVHTRGSGVHEFHASSALVKAAT